MAAIYTDSSKKEDSPVNFVVFSPDLHLAIKHKLPSDTLIFSAEAWASSSLKGMLNQRLNSDAEPVLLTKRTYTTTKYH